MVEIEIYPPLSFRFTSKRVGPYTVSTEIREGEVLSDLLARLSLENPEAWGRFFNVKTGKTKGPVRTVVNGLAVPSSALARTVLSEVDHISFRILYGGG